MAEIDAPLGRLPVLARAGAMVPASGQLDRVDPAGDGHRTLLLFGEEEGDADLYEDDGDTAAWRTGGLHVRLSRRRDGGRTIVALEAAGSWRPAFDEIALERVGPGSPVVGPDGGASLRLAPAGRS